MHQSSLGSRRNRTPHSARAHAWWAAVSHRPGALSLTVVAALARVTPTGVEYLLTRRK
jgi:hypothetical protein